MGQLLTTLLTNLLNYSICGAILIVGNNLPLAAQEKNSSTDLVIPSETLEESPVWQRWRKKIPNVLEDIRSDPSFRTRWYLGFSWFPSTDNTTGFSLGVEDVLIARTGITFSAKYQGTFDSDRTEVVADLHYFLFPLGGYLNFAPVFGYRYVQNQDFSTDGINVGIRLMLVLSRTGAADISLTQSFLNLGSKQEVGTTTLSIGYALTSYLRLATELKQQNSLKAKDSAITINLEWIP